MSVLTSLAELLGAGGEVVMALSVGLVGWYLVKALSGAKTAGAVVGSGVRMVAFAIGVLAVGIWRNWWDPDFGKFISDSIAAGQAAIDYGMHLVEQLIQLGVIT